MSLPLHAHARIQGVERLEILKVLNPAEARAGDLPPEDVLLLEDVEGAPQLRRSSARPIVIDRLRDPHVVRSGDVLRLRPSSSQLSVLYRRGVASNVLFVTERCNSRCLMCSQPPRDEDDSWRIAELLRLISLIDRDEPQLTVSGGEPTLAGEGLDRLLLACSTYLPDTRLQVLTNGRGFADGEVAARLAGLHTKLTWAVPLYADVRAVHDEVVDAPGAFEETLAGLYELGRRGARVEIRVVLHRLTLPRLKGLAAFIYRRLPFVAHVALMGLEPMGFAKANRDRLWIDPADYQADLAAAVFHLADRGVPVSVYNLPLCNLPRALWPFARQSISGWKNDFPDDCAPCALRSHCAGFFASAGPTWRSRDVRPFTLEEFAA